MEKSFQSTPDSQVKTLSKRQQRRSLGQTPQKATPTPQSPKPEANKSSSLINQSFENDDKFRALLTLTKTLIRPFKYPFQKKVPLAQIRQIPKSERSKYRQQWITEQCNQANFSMSNHHKLRSSVALGVNAVSKGLEKKNLLFILIDPDVKPFSIIELLAQLAQSKGVPVIPLKGFSNMFKYNGGMKCIAFGLKIECAQTNHHFYSLVEHIQNQLN